MTNQHHIQAELSQDVLEIVLNAIQTAERHLPFLIDLSVEERKGMLKFGDKSRGFIEKAVSIAEQHPEILPSGFNIKDMRNDVNLLESLYTVQHRLNTLLGKVDDTLYAVGSECYSHSLFVYQYAKLHNLVTGALEGALDDLGRRFTRKLNKTDKTKGNEGAS